MIERHDRALRKADERQRAVVEPALGQGFVDKGVEDRRRRPHARQLRPRAAILRAVPLVAIGCHVARKGRVRRQELGLRQQRRPIGREPDQIVAVGAEPVQQDDQMARLAARGRRVGRSGEFGHHRRDLSTSRRQWRRHSRKTAPLSSTALPAMTSAPIVTRFAPSPTGLSASRPCPLGARRMAGGARCRRALSAAARRYRSGALPRGIRRGDPRGPGLARARLGRGGAPAVGAFRRLSPGARPAGGDWACSTRASAPGARSRPRSRGPAGRRRARPDRPIPAPAGGSTRRSAPRAGMPGSTTRCGSMSPARWL